MTHGNEWYDKRRKDMIEYLGGECVACSSTSELEFDHIYPETKLFDVGACYSYRWALLVTELDKCQLLCKACHLLKSNSAYEEIHNEWRYLKHRCRCTVCKKEYSKYRRKRYYATKQ